MPHSPRVPRRRESRGNVYFGNRYLADGCTIFHFHITIAFIGRRRRVGGDRKETNPARLKEEKGRMGGTGQHKQPEH